MTELHDLLAAYPALSRRERLHMMVRWRVCPLPRIASAVPDEGVIIDLGCGHGLFTQLLARQSPRRSVIGIDLDAEKITLAQRLSLPNLRFVCGDIAATDVPPAQAITILDVFYLIPYAIQEQLLALCADKLAPGGAIVLKEMAEKPVWKVTLNQLEETLAVRVLGITASLDSRFYFRSRHDWQEILAKLGLAVETIPMDHGYYHPHVVFVAHKETARV